MTDNDSRLIEDYLPLRAISAEAAREKSIRKGHISTLHLWWARRPLVACRAAVYGALVSLARFRPHNGPEEKRDSLARANAAKFVARLCRYPGDPVAIAEAQRHILAAHAERLSAERGEPVTVEAILAGRAPRPKVLDMFAGGGAIPLEALRLGCDAYALELNPVAHLIELCTLVYPQRFGRPDPTARGMTGPKRATGEPTWGGLADEVRYWGEWVLERAKAQIGDLYPPIPDPEHPPATPAPALALAPPLTGGLGGSPARPAGRGWLTPVAYLWTRTVRCKNPACGATVPLVRQTWLCQKKKGERTPGRYVALRMVAPPGEKRVRFEVVEAACPGALGFDPAAFSKGGNAACPFCGTVADNDYVKAEGSAGRIGRQMMAIVCTRPGQQGKVYLAADDYPAFAPDDAAIEARIAALCQRTGLTVPHEPTPDHIIGGGGNCRPYGLRTWGDLFIPRQRLCLLAFAAAAREAQAAMARAGLDADRARAVSAYLGVLVDRLADKLSSLARWDNTRLNSQGTFARQALPMVWDFVEAAPFGSASGGGDHALEWIVGAIETQAPLARPATVVRGSATDLPWPDATFDAVVTDPPYYDNVGYGILSDFFYVWLKRTVGHLYPEHFATEGTPKRQEVVADPARHGGDRERARAAYERMMAQAFAEAHRVLKPGAPMVVVYAHKTTLGWSTLVEALRTAGFTVTEAWPLDTEMGSRLIAMETASLASSIFLVARKRVGAETGSYEREVRPELERIVRERIDTLWAGDRGNGWGIAGADLVIAAVGAGLRAFTRFARVEYANGEEVPAERFLTEVEGVVLETVLEKLFGIPRSGVAEVDGPSRFYVLWRYAYGAAELPAGEAIVFTYGQAVELDGPRGLSTGARALVEKKQGKYRLRDYRERGGDERLGLPDGAGNPAPLVDVLHRVLWLMDHQPRLLPRYLAEAAPDRERLRLVAQALAGPALAGRSAERPAASARSLIATTGAEQAALGRLLANWRPLIEECLAGRLL